VRSKFALLDAMHLGLDPDVALHLAERRFDDSSAFVTCTVVEVDPDTGTGRYANAGHPPGMVVTARGAARTLDPTGPLIGPFPAEWETRAFTLAAGETLVLYSDGVTEARNARGDELGTDAIVRAVAATPGGSANATMEALISELFQHAPDGFDDDITVVVVRRVAP
jgi:serine phosphatase RsbU (regulator of sigma subunit)